MIFKEIEDKKIWESFISEYSPQSFFQSYNWGEVYKLINPSKKGQKNLFRYGLYDNNELRAVFQTSVVNAKRGKFLHVRHGPVIDKWSEEIFGEISHFISDLGKQLHADFIRISPLIKNSELNRQIMKNNCFFDSPIHAMDGEYCWVLPLGEKDEEDLLSQMRKTTRYLIRKAQKMGVIIKRETEEKNLGNFLKLYKETASRHHFIEHKGIEEEFKILSHDNQIALFNGFYEDKLLSTAMIVFYNNQAIYHHSASIEQKIPVSYLLQYEVIKEAKKRGKKEYNFWGIAPLEKINHPWRGLSLFKQGFGGQAIEYLHAQDHPLTKKYYLTYLLDTYRKWRKGY